MKEISLLPDQAIGERGTTHADGLGFKVYADVLATAALHTGGPFTIGVFGEWGTGKTSLMRMIEQRLCAEDDVVTVWFNAWRYEQEEHPIVPLIATIIRELEKHERKKNAQKVVNATDSLVRALRAIAYGFSAKSKVRIPGLAEIEASFVAKDMIDRKERLVSDPLLDRSLYYEAFETLETVKDENELRIVILIDDLDRCFPDQAIRLLESVKLVLAQPGFIFVLAVARQVIEGYLQHRYSEEYGIKEFQGQLYLDKMVQLPFHIPPTVARMPEFSAAMLQHVPSEIGEPLADILPTIGLALDGNPRAIVRFVNNIVIDLAISSRIEDAVIPVEYFALSRCLQQRWPELFSMLASSESLAQDVASWDFDSLMQYAERPDEAGRAASAILVDRGLRTLLAGSQGKNWLRHTDLRDASISFLRSQRRVSPLDSSEVSRSYDVFLSYSVEDRSQVSHLAALLTEEGFRVALDDVETAAAERMINVTSVINRSSVVCICVGREEVNGWQMSEASQAMQRGIAVVPVLFRGANGADIPNPLRDLVWLDLRSGEITRKSIDVLVRHIQSTIR